MGVLYEINFLFISVLKHSIIFKKFNVNLTAQRVTGCSLKTCPSSDISPNSTHLVEFSIPLSFDFDIFFQTRMCKIEISNSEKWGSSFLTV